jgi:Flp pilus assembly pilin Flp
MCHFIAYTKCKMMRLRDDLNGVTAMEYGLLAGTTVVVGLAAVVGLGTSIAAVFATIGTFLATAAAGA